ncbi:MAG TPA: hybrid sensor histidine kinase/response regulator [Desulfobacteraceae bacterium]|nr:hybrid sensor histidine kinase/response regulator [Desulfobacteraceae bacterium]
MRRRIPTIMIIDDTLENLRVLEEMLKEAGYGVLAFPRGDLALRAVAKARPDLILLDIMMPGMDGFEVCRVLKSGEDTKHIPVLFISALGSTEDKVKALSLGGVDYVTKPFQYEEVMARVRTHVELQRQRKELAAAYEKLKVLEAQREKLTQMIVHDIRSLLTSIVGNLELAKMYSLSDEALKSVDRAFVSSKLLTEMTSSMLDVSRMEEEELPLRFTEVDIGSVTKGVLEDLGGLKGSRSVRVSVPDTDLKVKCDSQIIRRVIQNLLINAVKFTDKEIGSIFIALTASRDKIRVSIEDNGHGIPSESLDRVFDKFFQVSSIEKGQKYSTGLGLTFCKLAVEAHGGTIGVESEIGKGSTFWFELPRLPSTSPSMQH